MILLATTDFKTGKYMIADAGSNSSSADVLICINDNEKSFINQIFGTALATAIIAYLAANRTPTDANLDKLIDPFIEQDTNWDETVHESKGLKDILMAKIYYIYTTSTIAINGQAGTQNTQSETGKTNPGLTIRDAERRFNAVLDSIDAVQWWCLNNPSNYTNYPFNGQRITVEFSAML